jgi:hypothetical protein
MRLIFLTITLAGAVWGQTLGEVGAAVAGTAAGGAAGKKVSDGLSSILGKIDQQTAAAAGPAPKPVTLPAPPPLIEAGRGVPLGIPSSGIPAPGIAAPGIAVPGIAVPGIAAPGIAAPGIPAIDGPRKGSFARAAVIDSVPPPPPLPHTSAVKLVDGPRFQAPVPVVVVAPIAPPPPPVTIEDLRQITVGESRIEVLKLGAPSARITMFDDGHLMEMFRYMSEDTTFGVVRLSDGEVASVDLRR